MYIYYIIKSFYLKLVIQLPESLINKSLKVNQILSINDKQTEIPQALYYCTGIKHLNRDCCVSVSAL